MHFTKIIFVFILLIVTLCVWAQPKSTLTSRQRQVEKLVEKAVYFVNRVGKAKAVCQFNQINSPFRYRSVYVFAFVCNDGDSDGFFVSDPATPQYLFKNRSKNPLIRKMIERVSKHPKGVWLNYAWLNPQSNKVEPKHSYVVMIKDQNLCVGSGYYD